MKKFKIDCCTDTMSERDIYIIERYGYWLFSLINHNNRATTEKQRHFIDFHKGKLKADGEYENAWLNYRTQCLYEIARKYEKGLTSGQYEYQTFVEEYYRLACLGHKKSKEWLINEEQDNRPVTLWPSSLGNTLISISELYTLPSGAGKITAPLGNPTIDDRDSQGWEIVMGGPDDTE